MCLKEHYFFPGCLCQAQLVGDILLAPALHDHIPLLEMIGEVLHDLQDTFLGALVHQVWFGQDPCEIIRGGQWKGQFYLQIYWTLLGYGVFFGQAQQSIIFPLYILTTLVPNQLTLQTRIYFWACYSVAQICMSVFLLAPYCFNHSRFVIYLTPGIMMSPTFFFFIKIVMTKSLFCPVPLSSFFHSIVIPLICIFICSSSHSTHWLPCVIYLTNVSRVPAESPTLRQRASSEPTHSVTMSPKAHHSLLYGGSVTV